MRNLYTFAYLVYQYNQTAVALPDLPFPVDIRAASFFGDNQSLEFSFEPLEQKVSPPAAERILLWQSETYCTTTDCALEYWTINNVSFVFPPYIVLQHNYFEAEKKKLVWTPFDSSKPQSDFTSYKENRRAYRDKVPSYKNVTFGTINLNLTLNKVYEFVLVGHSMQQHPWHIHGYSVDFVEAGNFSSEQDMLENWPKVEATLPRFDQEAKLLTRGDSWTVPSWGYVVFRFNASNPGPWFFHCHV